MSESEKDLAKQLFDGPEKSRGVREAILAVAPGLKDAIPEIKEELKHMGAHGAHELAAALFNGSAYVMYPRDGHGVHGPDPAPEQSLQQDAPSQEMERGGRSM